MMAKKIPVSPFAPRKVPALPPVAGVHLATIASQSRYLGRDDVLLIGLENGARVAGVFTRSKTASAPIDLCRAHLRASKGRIGALVVNAGNANAFTGAAGAKAAAAMAQASADKWGCAGAQVFVASTGVIGELLDAKPIIAGIKQANLVPPKAAHWQAAMQAIMTTDTFPKAASVRAKFGDQTVTLNAIAKGSGMIAPDMATMLAFIFTDAAIPARLLQKLLQEAVAASLNCITVDSDTSTSDTCLLVATGKKRLTGGGLTSINDKRLKNFRHALAQLCQKIAVQIVGDGEGISKLMTIDVAGAENDQAARRIGLAVGNSPLVKTAIAGEDANWGRIIMAVGKSGERVDRDRLSLDIGGHRVARRGRVVANYQERRVATHLKKSHIHIAIGVGAHMNKNKIGKGKARVWASDLTHGYIDINGDYRS